jgi:hypothetical protein
MGMFFTMLVVFVAMLVTLAVAGLVVAYVAFVQRGRDIPRAPWLTEKLQSFVERWRVPTEPAQNDDPDRQLHVRQGGLRRPSRHGRH